MHRPSAVLATVRCGFVLAASLAVAGGGGALAQPAPAPNPAAPAAQPSTPSAATPGPAPGAAPGESRVQGGASDPVVARVDGQPIHLSDLAEATRTLPEELRRAPPQTLYPLLLDQMISQQAVLNAARRQGLDKDPQVQARIRRAEERELQQALLSREIAGAMSEEALRRRFEQAVASRPPEEEIRARHILVQTESAAREALAEVRRPGADFAEVARRRSSGPGAAEGGDLGFFKQGDMVPAFAEAAFRLQPGQISEAPVRSPFGWHVIRVEERRQAPPPAFEEVRDALRQQVLEEQVGAVVERLRNAAQVERFNLDGSPQQPPAGAGGGSLLDDAAPPPPAQSAPQQQQRR